VLVSSFFGVSFSSFYVLLGVFVIAFSLYFVTSVSSVGIQFVGSVVSFGARCLDSLPRKQRQSGLAHSSRKRYCCFRGEGILMSIWFVTAVHVGVIPFCWVLVLSTQPLEEEKGAMVLHFQGQTP
jgi:hypothetical protein